MTDPAQVPHFAMIHGGGQGSWVWEDVTQQLEAKGARALALDVPGCGTKRGRDVAALSVADIVEELAADIEAWTSGLVTIVGHSQAGTIMPMLAAQLGERVCGLIYVTCAAPPPGKTLLELIGTSIRGTHPDQVGRPLDPATTTREDMYLTMFCNDFSPEDGKAFVARLGSDQWPMSSMEFREWDYDITRHVPATYILCEQDVSLPHEWQERFAARLHCERTLRIDAGHQPMNTQPALLASMIMSANS